MSGCLRCCDSLPSARTRKKEEMEISSRKRTSGMRLTVNLGRRNNLSCMAHGECVCVYYVFHAWLHDFDHLISSLTSTCVACSIPGPGRMYVRALRVFREECSLDFLRTRKRYEWLLRQLRTCLSCGAIGCSLWKSRNDIFVSNGEQSVNDPRSQRQSPARAKLSLLRLKQIGALADSVCEEVFADSFPRGLWQGLHGYCRSYITCICGTSLVFNAILFYRAQS